LKKLTLKIIFDTALAGLGIFLLVNIADDSFLYEIAGVIFTALVIVHIGYSFPLLKKTAGKMFVKGQAKLTADYTVDIILLLLFVFTAVSGVLTSQYIFTSIYAADSTLWTALHQWAAYLTLITVSIHTGFHWRMVLKVVSRPFGKLSGTGMKPLKAAGYILAVTVLIGGFISMAHYDLPSLSGYSSTSSYSSGSSGSSQYGSGGSSQYGSDNSSQYGSGDQNSDDYGSSSDSSSSDVWDDTGSGTGSSYGQSTYPYASGASGTGSSLPGILFIMAMWICITHYAIRFFSQYRHRGRPSGYGYDGRRAPEFKLSDY